MRADTLYGVEGWFVEKWSHEGLALQYRQVLQHTRTPFQDLLVLRSVSYGTVLALDGVLQVTERDQFAYAEMVAHIPLFAHRKVSTVSCARHISHVFRRQPEHVLVVGSGDGASLVEILKRA